MNSPVEQFSIKILFALNLFGFDISFTNASLFMIISVLGSASVFYLGARKQTLVPNRFQSFVEISYEFVANMVKENAGKGSQIYFPFIFTLFMFILFGNLLGMIPYSYTFTSFPNRLKIEEIFYLSDIFQNAKVLRSESY